VTGDGLGADLYEVDSSSGSSGSSASSSGSGGDGGGSGGVDAAADDDAVDLEMEALMREAELELQREQAGLADLNKEEQKAMPDVAAQDKPQTTPQQQQQQDTDAAVDTAVKTDAGAGTDKVDAADADATAASGIVEGAASEGVAEAPVDDDDDDDEYGADV
jgi:hypothetical protein